MVRSGKGVLRLISANFDRISDLRADYEACTEAKFEGEVVDRAEAVGDGGGQVLKQIKTDMPAPDSKKTVRARRAANARWEHENAAG